MNVAEGGVPASTATIPVAQPHPTRLVSLSFRFHLKMFGGGAANPYDEIVGECGVRFMSFNCVLIFVCAGKTTDENLTSENWELILNLCDKVSDEGQEGCVAFLCKSSHDDDDVRAGIGLEM